MSIDTAKILAEGIERSRSDGRRWNVYGLVEKYDGLDADYRARNGIGSPEDYAECFGNLLTTAGLTRMTNLLTAGGGQALTNTSARIGVGDGSTAAAIGDTDLSAAAGSTHRQFEVMAATYPQVSAGVMTFRSVFSTSEANFAWAEWGIDIGTPTVAAGTTVGAVLLNRKVVSLGTKTSAAAWTFTVTITIA